MSNENHNSKTAIIVAIIGALGVIVAAVLQNCSKKENSIKEPPTLIASKSPDLGTGEKPPSPITPKAEIETAIETSYITKRNAFRNLNKETLRTSYTGEALKKFENLMVANPKIVAILVDYDYSKAKFDNYQIIENDKKAKIKATKTIKSITYWLNPQTCEGYQPEGTISEEFYLEKTSTGWLINNVDPIQAAPSIVYKKPCPFDKLP